MTNGRLTFDHTVTFLFFTALVAAACLVPLQSDTWWHLRAGQEMWSRHFVMLADEFSFTANGQYWPNHEWLGDVLLFAAYWAGGLPGVTLLAAACLTTATALSWKLMPASARLNILLMAVAIPALVFVWTVRPLVFSMLLLMIVLQLGLKSIYWPMPFVFVLWANLHGGVALGLVVLGALALADAYLHGVSTVWKWGVRLASAFVGTLLTPLGVGLWTTIPNSIHKSVANGIQEWRPAMLGWRDAPFWALAVVLVILTAAKFRKPMTRDRAAVTFVALALLPLAVRYRRNITPFVLAALPAISHNLWAIGWDLPRQAERRQHYRANLMLVSIAVVTCVLVVAFSWSKPLPRLQWRPVSPAVIAAVESCPGRIYNRFDDGGYLIWFAPRVPVFVDNRQDPFPLEFLQEHLHSESSGQFEPVFQHYRITCAFLPHVSPTARRLREAGWRTDLEDDRWIVLRRPGE
jgi:hypothetical protein